MKLTDFENEDALDLLADLIEPTTNIFSDGALQSAIKQNKKKPEIAKLLIKNHKSDVFEIIARMNGKEPKDFTCNPVTLLASVLEILNDKELVDFFYSQAQTIAPESSQSVMGNIKAKGQ